MRRTGAHLMHFARNGGRLHTGLGAPWREALAALGTDAHVWEYPEMTPGDLLLTTLDTRPPLVLCLERVASYGKRSKVATIAETLWQGPLVGLREVERRAGVRLRPRVSTFQDSAADAVLVALGAEIADPAPIRAKEGRCSPSQSRDRSSGLQAAALALSNGRCSGCASYFGEILDGAGWGALEVHHLHHLAEVSTTVDSSVDDVRVVCGSCHNMLHRPPHPSLLDLKYAWRPRCPKCGTHEANRLRYGLPSGPPDDGEVDAGCAIPDTGMQAWSCGSCGARWGRMDRA